MGDDATRPALTGVCPLLSVHDMNRAVAFYRDQLGFDLVQHAPFVEAAEGRYFHWAYLRRGPAELMLNTAYDADERPAEVDAARRAAHGDTYLYFGCDDPDAVHADLVAHGVAAEAPKDAPYGMRQVFVTDPDGYNLVFQRSVAA
jgi:catechol 2,3-dioxygenase-like lactoylglutathione lyase family enzyme